MDSLVGDPVGHSTMAGPVRVVSVPSSVPFEGSLQAEGQVTYTMAHVPPVS